MNVRTRKLTAVLWLAFCGVMAAQTPPPAGGQGGQVTGAPGARGGFRPGPAVVSPQIEPDGRVTFRILAPNARNVTVGGDINGSLVPDPAVETATRTVPPAGAQPQAGFPNRPPAVAMTKGENGIWAGTTVRAVKPGAWRYTFNVDGLTTVDSRNARVSPNQTQVQSLLVVPGDFSETRDVPHGTLGLVRYVAASLGSVRREMYVYTPPRYEKGTQRYPVLYLIHGGGDTAISWPTVGRANDILDNLIAEKKALPMIVVMPCGWTPSGGQVMTADAAKDPFNDEMMKDIIPYMDSTYRTIANPDGRALSGLSMGGIQTLNIGLHNLGAFRYLAVMSSGWTTEQDREFFYKSEAARIPTYNKALKLFWWGWGETDIARANGLQVIEKLKSQGVRIETRESPGGHEWSNWRLYLYEVAPKLFR